MANSPQAVPGSPSDYRNKARASYTFNLPQAEHQRCYSCKHVDNEGKRCRLLGHRIANTRASLCPLQHEDEGAVVQREWDLVASMLEQFLHYYEPEGMGWNKPSWLSPFMDELAQMIRRGEHHESKWVAK